MIDSSRQFDGVFYFFFFFFICLPTFYWCWRRCYNVGWYFWLTWLVLPVMVSSVLLLLSLLLLLWPMGFNSVLPFAVMLTNNGQLQLNITVCHQHHQLARRVQTKCSVAGCVCASMYVNALRTFHSAIQLPAGQATATSPVRGSHV